MQTERLTKARCFVVPETRSGIPPPPCSPRLDRTMKATCSILVTAAAAATTAAMKVPKMVAVVLGKEEIPIVKTQLWIIFTLHRCRVRIIYSLHMYILLWHCLRTSAARMVKGTMETCMVPCMLIRTINEGREVVGVVFFSPLVRIELGVVNFSYFFLVLSFLFFFFFNPQAMHLSSLHPLSSLCLILYAARSQSIFMKFTLQHCSHNDYTLRYILICIAFLS